MQPRPLKRILWVLQVQRDVFPSSVLTLFFSWEFNLKYLAIIPEHTNQGHNAVIYHLFTTDLLLCHAPTVVQPGNSANTPSRRGAPIRAFIIPFCDLQNWFFTKISDTDNQWQLIDVTAHQIIGPNNLSFSQQRPNFLPNFEKLKDGWKGNVYGGSVMRSPACYQEIPRIITLVTRTWIQCLGDFKQSQSN